MLFDFILYDFKLKDEWGLGILPRGPIGPFRPSWPGGPGSPLSPLISTEGPGNPRSPIRWIIQVTNVYRVN